MYLVSTASFQDIFESRKKIKKTQNGILISENVAPQNFALGASVLVAHFLVRHCTFLNEGFVVCNYDCD